MQIAIKKLLDILFYESKGGELLPLKSNMSKSFLIAICIIIAIALLLFPLVVSYKEQKNKKK